MVKQNKPNGQGLTRVIKAGVCSWAGIRAAIRYESAFRQELLLCCLLLPLAIYLANSLAEVLILTAALLLVLLAELMNSAIEAVVDRVGLEHHELSGRAKDMGSAVVVLSICICTLVWGAVVLPSTSSVAW